MSAVFKQKRIVPSVTLDCITVLAFVPGKNLYQLCSFALWLELVANWVTSASMLRTAETSPVFLHLEGSCCDSQIHEPLALED